MIFKTPVALLFSLVIGMSASAAPVVLSSIAERDVWVPPVTSPKPGTIWTVGKSETVTWYVERAGSSPLRLDIVWRLHLICSCDRDTSTRPPEVSNPIGTLLLGYLNADGSGGENLDVGQSI